MEAGMLLIGLSCATIVGAVAWDIRHGPCSPILLRYAAAAYGIILLAVISGFVHNNILTGRLTDRIDDKATTACVAGNKRSDIARDDFTSSYRQIETLDVGKLFGIGPEQVADFRRLSKASANRRITALPYTDCATGDPLPSPPPLP